MILVKYRLPLFPLPSPSLNLLLRSTNMVHRANSKKSGDAKGKRSRKDSTGRMDADRDFGMMGGIPPELDEDIDDDLAFDSEDEAKYGAFFASKSKPKKKGTTGTKDDTEITDTFDRLNAIGDHDEEMGFSDDSREEFDLSEMLESKDELRDARANRRLAKKKNQKQKIGRRSSVKEPLTLEAETLIGSTEAVPAGSRLGVRKLLDATPDAAAAKRLQKSLANNKLLLTQDVDDITKERVDRKKVREVVAGQLEKYKPVLKQHQTARHLAFPLRAQEAVCPVPKTLTSLVSAVQEGTNENREEAAKRAAASTNMADRMNSLLQASGLLKESKSQTTDEQQKSQFVAFDSGTGEEGDDALKPISVGYMQKLKSMLSFENAKRRRFNKIKSKTYRRILRKEKERDQERRAKAFELLHPEEARRRLQKKMDEMRAEERVTQKHKNTSKWVRHAKKFANVDADTKDAIDEQHQIHARLMQKMEEDLADEINGAAAANDDEGSEEEEQVVDQLLAGGGKTSAKSVLWGDEGEDGSGPADVTPVDKARKELRAMGFMQKAKQRQDDQLDEELKDLEADIREYHETGELSRAADLADEKRKGRKRHAKDSLEALAADDEDALVDDDSEGDAAPSKKTKKTTKNSRSAELLAGPSKGRRQYASGKKDMNVSLGAKSGLSIGNENRDVQPAENGDGNTAEEPIVVDDARESDVGEFSRAVAEEPRKKKARPEVRRPVLGEGFAGDRSTKAQDALPKKVGKCASTRVTILPKIGVAPPSVVEPVAEDGVSMNQDYLVARAFANDEVDEEFLALKSRQVEDIMKPADKNASLPGWGEWGGEASRLNVAHQARVAKMELERRIEKSSLMKARADAELENVIINHEVDLVPGKYQLHMVPRPFTNAQEFSRSLRQPLGPEWNTALSFKEGNQPRITTIQGVAIDPLSLEAHVKKSKTQRRKVALGKKSQIAVSRTTAA
jgi:U3 small nucleolar RNA-associated protein 14